MEKNKEEKSDEAQNHDPVRVADHAHGTGGLRWEFTAQPTEMPEPTDSAIVTLPAGISGQFHRGMPGSDRKLLGQVMADVCGAFSSYTEFA